MGRIVFIVLSFILIKNSFELVLILFGFLELGDFLCFVKSDAKYSGNYLQYRLTSFR